MSGQYDIQDSHDGKRIRFAVAPDAKAQVFADLMELLKDHIVQASISVGSDTQTGQFTDTELKQLMVRSLSAGVPLTFRVWGDSCGVSHSIAHTPEGFLVLESKNLIFAKRIAKRYGLTAVDRLSSDAITSEAPAKMLHGMADAVREFQALNLQAHS